MGLTIQQVASRAFLLLGTTGPLFATYFWINQRNSVEHAPLTMPDWVPFLPILALPYLALLWTPTLGIFFIREQQCFVRYVISFVIAYGTVAAIWIFFPSEMTRPELAGDGWSVYREMVSLDRPVCILPCGHIVGPMLVCYFLAQENHKHLYWLIPILAFGSFCIIATWQHRPVDVFIGMVIASCAAWICQRVLPTKPGPHPKAP
tara:strand:- start:1010 stop:1624 length:615 start_codon:yes stop_codon:yes gene_type:complete